MYSFHRMHYRCLTLLLGLVFITSVLTLRAQAPLYYPPQTGNQWETLSPESQGFCPERIDSLYAFLARTQTRGFLLLKDGRIVLEKYFGTVTQDSFWYWASAGKTLTAALTGMAVQEGILDLQDPSSTFLGKGWTSLPAEKEDKITIRHHLTMTTGLDDKANIPTPGEPDNCTDPKCLVYKADAGTRWAYHNAPYILLHPILEKASKLTINQYTNRLKTRLGMSGLWIDHVYYSRARDMARFGLLIQGKGIWKQDTVLKDKNYFQAMVTPSQDLNRSYGYLWWLNGQSSFMLPGLAIPVPGPLVPSAPADMIAALGKNDQKIHVVPSKGWILVRQGLSSSLSPVPTTFDREWWDYLNALTCNTTANTTIASTSIRLFPNPVSQTLQLQVDFPGNWSYQVLDLQGRVLARGIQQGNTEHITLPQHMAPGIYNLQVSHSRGYWNQRFVKE